MRKDEIEARLAAAEEATGHRFSDRNILLEGLTHRSFANENARFAPDNDRMEFLGDAVLDLVIGEYLYRRYPELDSGAMTKLRASLVNEGQLAAIARDIDLGNLILLGVGEEKTGGEDKPSILADSFEALLGALYLDGGLSVVSEFLEKRMFPRVERHRKNLVERDPKSLLQEVCAKQYKTLPVYDRVERLGPDHDTRYVVECRIEDRVYACGEGRSVKQAEQAAAKATLERIHREEENREEEAKP